MLICLTGKSGSGKTSVAKLLCALNPNTLHLDIDEVGHIVLTYKEVQNELQKHFGEDIVINNVVDRRKLSDLVFSNKENMNILDQITKEPMEKYIDEFIIKNKDKNIVLDWILLPETKYFKQSDLKILVDVPYEVRLKRILERDKITEERFKRRESASIEYDLNSFDLVLENTDYEDTKRKVAKIYG